MHHRGIRILISPCLLGFIFCRICLAIEPPLNPINELGEVWGEKAVSTASGMIHIQWRYTETLLPDSYRIYRDEGEENPFPTEEAVQQAIPWRIGLPGSICFFRYLPEDEEEGEKMWFMVRAVKGGQESGNLDAESVIVDLPWINGLNDYEFLNFYVEDDERSDSFLQESQVCPFCSERGKIYLRLSRAYLAKTGDHGWYYVDCSFDSPEHLADVADCFENLIYPTNLEKFGRPDSDWTDVDDNGHIIILFTRLSSNIRGRFNRDDKLPDYQDRNCAGNYADMFYISSRAALKAIKSCIAHEFQHMQHFEANAEKGEAWEELWLNEACSEFAKEVNNLLDPDESDWYWFQYLPNEISLTRFGFFDVHERFGGCPIHWNESQENENAFHRVLAHYDQVAIWAHYMEYNASPVTSLASLVEDPDKGLISVQNHLGKDFQEVFTNWTIANYTNPYTDSGNTFYHYTVQFPNSTELFETHQVIPTVTISPEWVKSPEHISPWQERSLRELSADYVLLPHNGLLRNHVHWEVTGINGQENLCHAALIDQTDPDHPVLHEVVNIPIGVSEGTLTIFEEEKDLSSCLIVTNIAGYKDKDYVSSYQYRAYLTQNPRIVRIRLNQNQNEWLLGDSAVQVKAGLMRICIQFDQSMSQAASSDFFLNPQGDGAGEGPIAFQPASASWSQTMYPADTWSGAIIIPENNGEEWDGLAELVISGVKNFCHEPLEESQRFSFLIDTQPPGQVTDLVVCFIDQTAEIRWAKNTDTDLLGYNLYGTFLGNEPYWIPPEELNNPNTPFFSLSNLEPGIYEFSLTASDKAGNEGPFSERTGLAIQVEIPLFAGQNMVSYPIQAPSEFTSEYLLYELGFSTKSMRRYVPELSVYQTSFWIDGVVQGIFPIIQDEGYLIYQQEAGCLTLSGPIKDREISLYAGKNLIGIPFLSFYENLLDVSRDLMEKKEGISSILYYKSQEGKWTCSYDFFGKISGPCTKVKKGSGCLIYIWN